MDLTGQGKAQSYWFKHNSRNSFIRVGSAAEKHRAGSKLVWCRRQAA